MRSIGVQANLLPDSAVSVLVFPDGARSLVSLQIDCENNAEISLLCKAGSSAALHKLAAAARDAAAELDRHAVLNGGVA
ncbi:hypothetical protein ACWGH2_16415 [Streptomyces sp. NPDC054871]